MNSFKVKLTAVGLLVLCIFSFLEKHTRKCLLWVRELCQCYTRNFCFSSLLSRPSPCNTSQVRLPTAVGWLAQKVSEFSQLLTK